MIFSPYLRALWDIFVIVFRLLKGTRGLYLARVGKTGVCLEMIFASKAPLKPYENGKQHTKHNKNNSENHSQVQLKNRQTPVKTSQNNTIQSWLLFFDPLQLEEMIVLGKPSGPGWAHRVGLTNVFFFFFLSLCSCYFIGVLLWFGLVFLRNKIEKTHPGGLRDSSPRKLQEPPRQNLKKQIIENHFLGASLLLSVFQPQRHLPVDHNLGVQPGSTLDLESPFALILG